MPNTKVPKTKVRVADDTQILHDGTVHEAGSTFEADTSAASKWIEAGIATEARESSAKPTRRTRARS